MTTTTERFRRVQGDAKAHLAQRMFDREQAIISRLVMAYRSGTLNSNDLFGGIAAISELRSISSEVERDLMQATSDAEAFTKS